MRLWDYRVVKVAGANKRPVYRILEVYYGDSGTVISYIDSPIHVLEEPSKVGLNSFLNQLQDALTKPVLVKGIKKGTLVELTEEDK